jgi:hypothetical protein
LPSWRSLKTASWARTQIRNRDSLEYQIQPKIGHVIFFCRSSPSNHHSRILLAGDPKPLAMGESSSLVHDKYAQYKAAATRPGDDTVAYKRKAREMKAINARHQKKERQLTPLAAAAISRAGNLTLVTFLESTDIQIGLQGLIKRVINHDITGTTSATLSGTTST